MLRIFLKDILDKKIVFRYTLFSFVLYFLANEYFAKYAIMNKVLVKRAEVYIIIGLCFSVFFCYIFLCLKARIRLMRRANTVTFKCRRIGAQANYDRLDYCRRTSYLEE